MTFDAAEGYALSHVSDAVEAALDAYQPPEGYEVTLSGENETVNEIMGDMVFMMAVALVLIFLIMVAQFQSFKSPFIVLFTIPLAFTGGLIALLLTGMDLSIVAMVGFLVLMGVVVNNGIVFVDSVNQMRIAGMTKREALLETRPRPPAPDPDDRHHDDPRHAHAGARRRHGLGDDANPWPWSPSAA